MNQHSFIRVATVSPTVHLANVEANLREHLVHLQAATTQSVDLLVFPELSLTGYTCHDLFHQRQLQLAALQALKAIVYESRNCPGIIIIGMPWAVDQQLYNCAVVIHQRQILGVVPKTHLPNYKEFYESRYFAPATHNLSRVIRDDGQDIPFGIDLLFILESRPDVTIGVEICEDLWTPIPPSSRQAIAGATLLINLSASPEAINKDAYRRSLVLQQSARCIAAYIYAASGPGESTGDLVYGGHCMIAENGTMLGESPRYVESPELLIADIDVEHLQFERIQTTTFAEGRTEGATYRRIPFALKQAELPQRLLRTIDAHPFRPRSGELLRARCEEIFAIQLMGLSRRLEHVGVSHVTIGVSGGLDSTLALLVTAKAMVRLKRPPTTIHGYTMPGFGTTSRTLRNARHLMGQLGITAREIDIRELCFQEMLALQHAPFGISLEGLTVDTLEAKLRELPPDQRVNDLVFENVQARMRTSLLMNSGFVIGTGDLSELALGWCTYNADHMSMYNPNVSIPKTLVKFLVEWASRNQFDGDVRATLLDVVATKMSPELLPTAGQDQIVQSTESIIGPYELHDFFLYHFLRYGTAPRKILYLAEQATFDHDYPRDTIKHWLKLFLKRFFMSQFKRSCLPDGPKVGSVSLSPRGDWRMPSDALVQTWLNDCDDSAEAGS